MFKFLHDLVTDMHRVGDDVWTPAAVKYIKILACHELWRALESVLSGREIGETLTNGNTHVDAEEVQEVVETEQTNGDTETNGDGEVQESNGNGAGDQTDPEEDAQKSEPEKETRVNGNSHKMIGMDWAIQLLFDALYLDEALQRKGSNARNSGISSLAGKIEAAVGIRVSPQLSPYNLGANSGTARVRRRATKTTGRERTGVLEENLFTVWTAFLT